MKKIYLPLFAGLLFLNACSNNEKAPGDTGSDGIVFELSAVSQLSTTRAPLYSQEAVQHVKTVNVYVFQKSGSDYLYLKTYPISDWVTGSVFQRYEVPVNEMLPSGDYKFLAVGTDDSSPYNLTVPTATTNFDNFSASISSAANQELEIFAGSKAASVVGTGVRVPIQMTRQVAGVLGYFKNVPNDIGGKIVKYLRLTVSNANLNVNLTTGIGSNPVNTVYNIINVDLSGQAVNADGAYTGNDLTAQGVVKLDNTQLNGAFLLPVNGITMTLGLYDASNAPLKTWTVTDGGQASFNIQPNHFYALGIKTQAGNTTGGGGEGSTPDSPIDLMKDQAITVTILPNWALIHNLVIQ